MTFENFFTRTELNDGLTAPSRVKELFAVIKEEKDCVGENVSDKTRQWSIVASTIIATANKDCLDLFVCLDGLQLIDRWLQDAQKFGNETGDIVVEESIAELLRALEKLPIGNHKLASSGIWMTVKNLVGHNSSRVQDRARALFESWKQDGDSDAIPLQDDSEKVDALCDDDGLNVRATGVEDGGRSECYSRGISPSRGTCGEENNVEHARDEMVPPICSDTLQPEGVGVKIQTSEKTSAHVTMINDGPPAQGTLEGQLDIKDDPATHSLEGNCGTTVSMQGTLEGQLDIAGLNQLRDDVAQQMRKISSHEKLAAMDNSSVGSLLEQRADPSSVDVRNASEFAIESDSKEDIARRVMYEGNSAMNDGESSNDCRTTNQNSECHSDVVQDSSGNKHNNLGDSVEVGEAREQANDVAKNDSDLSKLAAGAENRDVRPDIEPEYVVDPIEVARQVANDVEREVTDCRERSCGSSEKILDSGTRQPDSPDTTREKQNRACDGSPKEVSTEPNLSAKASLMGEEPLTKAENLGAEQGSSIHDMDFSSVTEAAHEPEATTEKGFCDFDLNQEFYSEDEDQQVNPISTPISVVSASRAAAAAATGLPVAPLQFEGTLGWKGSAATSAFRPASPRWINEGDKKICVDFDLNVAEGSDDNKIIGTLPEKQIQMSYGFPSGESSVEASPRKSERLHLDLNRVSDANQFDWGREGRLLQHRDGLRSPSPSSTSSSIQPALRNIDLNDNPSFWNDYLDHPFGKSSQNLNVSGGFRADDSAISIMGARVEVNRQNFVPQTLPLPNGKVSMSTVDLNLAGPGGVLGLGSAVSQYIHSPLYGYSGLVPGSAVYRPGGPIPYVGSSSSAAALLPAFSQTPYLMSMSGAPPGSSGGVRLWNNFDLNSGSMMEEINMETTGGFRQLFSEGRSSINEHLRENDAQASSSCTIGDVGIKRKEAAGGLEFYPVNFKRHQPPPWI